MCLTTSITNFWMHLLWALLPRIIHPFHLSDQYPRIFPGDTTPINIYSRNSNHQNHFMKLPDCATAFPLYGQHHTVHELVFLCRNRLHVPYLHIFVRAVRMVWGWGNPLNAMVTVKLPWIWMKLTNTTPTKENKGRAFVHTSCNTLYN